MTSLDHVARIARLSVVLRLRDAVIAPVVTAVARLPETTPLLIGGSAHGSQLEIVMPYHPDAFAVLAPTLAPPAKGDRLWLRVDREQVSFAVTIEGRIGVADGLADLPSDAAWRSIIVQLTSICEGRIANRGRWYGSTTSGFVVVEYPPRNPETDVMLMMGIDQLAEDIGVAPAQRRLWQSIHGDVGHGEAISVITSFLDGHVSNQLGIAYSNVTWQLAVRLAEGLVLNDSEAKQVPAELGQLAGAIGADQPQSIELRFGPHDPPDVFVWGWLAPGV